MSESYGQRRGVGGFRQTGGLLRGRLGKSVIQRGFSETRLIAEWDSIAGDLAARCSPVKLSQRAGAGGVLTIAVAGADAPEMSMQIEVLRARINAALGYGAVTKIRLSQSAPVRRRGLAEAGAAFSGPPSVQAEVAEETRAALEGLGEGKLRDVLNRLGRHVASKQVKQERKS